MSGRVWRFGDDVDTDALAPGRYMKAGIDEISRHCLEALRPEFAAGSRPGDIVVAGRNFGIGSSREQAVEALRHLGISGVVAVSFGGIFYRNAINLGLPVLECADPSGVADGARASVDPAAGTLTDHSRGATVACAPVPPFLLPVLDAGGLLPWLERRLQAQRSRRVPSAPAPCNARGPFAGAAS